MPQAVSKKQYRMMMAIAHGKIDPSKVSGRGAPPKSVASKYTSPGKDAPEQHGENRGGDWTEAHHAAHGEGKKHKSEKKSKKHGKLHKSAAAAIVMDDNGRFLMGDHVQGGLAFPGGHADMGDDDLSLTALRELHEETGLKGHNPSKVWQGKNGKEEVEVFLVESFTGEPKSSSELKNLRWLEAQEIDWKNLRACCKEPLKDFITMKLGKSLKGMLSLENLQKNIIRQRADAVFEVTHGDALKLVGNGVFRLLKEATAGMKDEDFKDVHIDTHTLSIRKHMNDVYSGRVSDGHKVVYQFTNKSLPEMTAALMSVFEWYMPEDEKFLNMIDDSIDDKHIDGGLNQLMDDYKKHNIANIYHEMENIRGEIRNGMAVDLQQVEARIMMLFDKLEDAMYNIIGKHNKLSEDAGKEIDNIESKLLELQNKLEEMGKKPERVEAYSSNPPNKDKIMEEFYPYLSKPKIEILPSGKITIVFESDWQHLEKENFLSDMKAKVLKRSKV